MSRRPRTELGVMNSRAKTDRWSCLRLTLMAALLLLVGLTACNSSSSSSRSSYSFSGLVVLDEPVVGATLTLTSTDGQVLYTETDKTYVNGSFHLAELDYLPNDFDLVASGGSLGVDGPPMLDVLRLEVRNFSADGQAFYVIDPVSTLTAAYHQKHPEKSHDEALAAVWDFLRLPDTADAANDTYFLERYFHRGAFMEAARDAGGLQPFVSQLVTLMDDPTADAPCFSETCDEDLLTGAAGFIAGAVAKGALGYVGGEAAGYVMKEAFGWGEEPPNRQDEIIDMLHEQSALLNDVLAEVKDLENQIDKATQLILAQLNETEYNLKASHLIEMRSFVDDAYKELNKLTLLDPSQKGYPDLVVELAKRLERRDLKTDLETLHNTLLGQGPGEKGLLDIWSEIQHQRAFGQDTYPEMADFINYWYDVQLKTLHLLIEYYHFKYPENTLLVDGAISSFENHTAQQIEKFLHVVETFNYVDRGYYSETGFLYDPRIASYCWNVFHRPFLDQADWLRGQLLGKEKSLTVRLYNDTSNYAKGARLDQVNLKLRNLQTGEIYTGELNLSTFEVWDDVTHQQLFNGNLMNRAQIGRYEFKDLPFGDYQLVNENSLYGLHGVRGTDGLLDIEARDHVLHFTPEHPFMHMTIMAWNQYYLHSSPWGCP